MDAPFAIEVQSECATFAGAHAKRSLRQVNDRPDSSLDGKFSLEVEFYDWSAKFCRVFKAKISGPDREFESRLVRLYLLIFCGKLD